VAGRKCLYMRGSGLGHATFRRINKLRQRQRERLRSARAWGRRRRERAFRVHSKVTMFTGVSRLELSDLCIPLGHLVSPATHFSLYTIPSRRCLISLLVPGPTLFRIRLIQKYSATPPSPSLSTATPSRHQTLPSRFCLVPSPSPDL
jgi:hypothetical protein